MDVGLCPWWLVGVVTTMVVGGYCYSSDGCVVVVDDGNDRKMLTIGMI